MKKSVAKTLFSAVLTIAVLTTFLYNGIKIADTATSNLIPNGDFSKASFSPIYSSNVPTEWEINEFDYDSSSKTLTCDKRDEKIKTSNSVSIAEGFYSLTAKTSATKQGIKIKLSYGTTAEETFDLTEGTNENTVYFYTTGASEKVTLQITEINGGEITVNEISLTESTGEVETEEGASIRVQNKDSGIRFKGKVDKNTYDKLIEQFGEEQVEVGIMIVPTDYLNDGTEFTIDGLKGKEPLVIAAEKWNNAETAEQDGYYGFNCAMTDIYPENTDRKFSARAYVKYNTGTKEKYSYAEYDEAKHSRSVYEIANKAKQDEKTSAETIEVIDAYLKRIDIKELKGTDFNEANDSYTIALSYTGIGLLKIESEELNKITVTVKENGKEVTPQNGYYKITDYDKIELSYKLNSFSLLNTLNSLTVKFYYC